jgi:hypothetical protein
MVQKPKTLSEFQADILRGLASTGISNLSPGGKARAFLDICADKCSEVDFRAFSNLNQMLLPYAAGGSLDTLGDIFGVARIQQQDAKISPYDSNLKFYVRAGTFADINNGDPIVIPDNIQVTTTGPGGPIYLLDGTTINPSANFQYVSARSLSQGNLGNISERVLNTHNFRNYAAAASGSLLIINEHGVTGGRETESDESYRFRIALKLKSQNNVNESALRYQMLQVPGVQDVVFTPYSGGFYVYLYSISPSVSSDVLSVAQRFVNESIAFPINATVLSPDLTGISVSTTVKVKPMTSSYEGASVANNARTAAAQYISNLRVGETMYINSIAAAVRASDPRILDVGQANNQIPEIFIWRSRSDSSRYSRFLVNDYVPQTGERIIVETSVSVPINIQVVQ